MVKKLLSLKEISEYYDTYYFDQWGVVHDGINIFDEAEQIFSYLQSQNKKIYIISNSGKKSSDNTDRLIKMGAKNILKSHLITSGDVCLEYLKSKKNPFENIGNKYFVVATDYPLLQNTTFEKTSSIENANFLLLTSTTGLKKTDLIDEIYMRAIEMKLPLVCSNPDILGVSGENIHPSTGDLAVKYKKMGGQAFIIGKPNIEIFHFVQELSNSNKSKTLMIGDSLFNDIAGANSFGIDSLLITSGIHKKEFMQNIPTNDIIDNIKSDFQITGKPNYIMDRLK